MFCSQIEELTAEPHASCDAMAELGKRMAALQRDMQLLQTLARNQKALTANQTEALRIALRDALSLD